MSDHISGPRALAEPAGDITDLYAFPTPGRSGWLSLVLNTRPFAEVADAFSDGLIYRFRLRSMTTGDAGGLIPFAVSHEESVLDVVFEEPTTHQPGRTPAQEWVCQFPAGRMLRSRVGEVVEQQGLRVFAGARWDPFIMDAPAALKTIESGQLSFRDPSSIFLDGKNVLSIVIDIDCRRIIGSSDVFAVVGETLTRGKLAVRIERTGRPEVKNMLLAPKQFDRVNRDLEIRDLYNSEDAFRLADTYRGAYRARLNSTLAFWDSLDGKTDWPVDERGDHPLTQLMLADFLVVDVSQPFTERGSFLEIELAARDGHAHRTGGGRSLNDDVIDRLFTLWVNGGNGPSINDGVDQSSRPATTVFPYLAAPNSDPPRPPGHHTVVNEG